MSGLLDPALCRPSPEWSGGDHPGALCDPSVDFHRVSLNNPSPSSLQGKDLVLSNQHGTSRHTHTHTWAGTHVHTHAHTHGDTHMGTHTYTHKDSQTNRHTHRHAHIQTHTHTSYLISMHTQKDHGAIN